jgi:hypothetical protein
VPISRPESWPEGERVPVPLEDFERWWRGRRAAPGEPVAPLLERAVYSVGVMSDGSWGGDFEWTVFAPGGNASWLRIPSTEIVLEALRGDPDHNPDWGLSEAGEWLVRVGPGRTRLLGKWSRPDKPSPPNSISDGEEVGLDVPLGVTTRLRWRTAVGRTLVALSPATVIPGKVDGEMREWLVGVGAGPVRVAFRDNDRDTVLEPGRPVYTLDTAVAVRPDSTRCQSDIVVSCDAGPLGGLTLRLPEKSSLLSVHLQDTPLETRHPEVERPEVVEVQFPEPLTGDFGPLRVRWIAGPREAGTVIVEAPQIEGGVFLDGNIAVRVEPPFRLSDIDPFGMRASGANSRPDGDAISARQWRRDARMTLRIGEAPFSATVDQALRVHVGPSLAAATVRTVWTATGGQARSLSVRVPEPWSVLDVRPVGPGVTPEGIAWRPGTVERSVDIELVDPLSPGVPISLDLVVATPRTETSTGSTDTLPVPVAIPLTGTAAAASLAVTTSDGQPYRVRVNGVDIPAAPWPERLASLTAPPGDANGKAPPLEGFPLGNASARIDIQLEDSRDPVAVRCVVSVVADDDGRLAEHVEIVARPVAGSVDRFHLQGLDESSRWNWTLISPSALRATVRRLEPPPADEVRSPRADEPFDARGSGSRGEWLVELSEPVAGPIVLAGTREGIRPAPCDTALPRAPRARSFEGRLRLDAPRNRAPSLTGEEWSPGSVWHESGDTRADRLRTEWSYPERAAVAAWTQPVASAVRESELECEAEIECLLGGDDAAGQLVRHLVSIRLHGLPTRSFDLAWKLSEQTVRCRCIADGRPVPVVHDGVRFTCAIPPTASLVRRITVEYEYLEGDADGATRNVTGEFPPRWISTAELPLPVWSPRVAACTLSVALPRNRELAGAPVGPQGFWNEVLAAAGATPSDQAPSNAALFDAIVSFFGDAAASNDSESNPSEAFRAGDFVSPVERRSARRFHVVGSPARVRVSVYNTSHRDVLGWFVACLSLAVALAIRRFRGPSTRRWRLFVPLMLLPLVAVAPEPLRTVAAAGLAAYALGWILPARWLRPDKREARVRPRGDRSGISRVLPATVACLCALLVGPSAALAQPGIPASEVKGTGKSSTLEVLIPVDDGGRPPTDGAKAYVPVELLPAIDASRQPATGEYLAGPAEYRIAPGSDGSLRVIARIEFQMADASKSSPPSAPALVALPWNDVRWDPTEPALVNGRPATLARNDGRVALLVPRDPATDSNPKPDREVAVLAFHIPLVEGRWTLPLPSATQHRLTRDGGPEAGNVTTRRPLLVSVDGDSNRPWDGAAPLRTGPRSKRIEIRPSNANSADRAKLTCTAESVVEARSEVTLVRVALSGAANGPAPGRWRWEIPAGWELGSLSPTAANPRFSVEHRDGQVFVDAVRIGAAPIEWSVEFTLRRPKPLSDESVELPPPAWIPSGTAGDGAASFVVEGGAPRVLLRTLPGFEIEFADTSDPFAVPLPPDAQLSARVPSDLPAWGMYQAVRNVPWRFVVREAPSQLKIETDLDVLVERDRLAVVLSAWIDDPTRSRMVYRPRLPEGMVVTDVEVLDGEVSRLWRWSREVDGLNVLLSDRPRQRQRLVVRGTVAVDSHRTETSLPTWNWPGEVAEIGLVSLWSVPGIAPIEVAGGPPSQPKPGAGPFPAAEFVGRWTGVDAPASFRRTTHDAGRSAYGLVRGLGTTATGAMRIEYRLRLFGAPLVVEFPTVVFPKAWGNIAPHSLSGVTTARPAPPATAWEIRPAEGGPDAVLEAVWTAEVPAVEGEPVWRVFPPAVSRVGTLETAWVAHRNLGLAGKSPPAQPPSSDLLKVFDNSGTGDIVPLVAGGVVVSGKVEQTPNRNTIGDFPDYWQHLVRVGADGGIDGETWAFFPGDSDSTFVPLPDSVEVLARVGERGIATQSVDRRIRVTDEIPPSMRMEHVRWRVPVHVPAENGSGTGGTSSTSGQVRVASPAAPGDPLSSPWSIIRQAITFSGPSASRPQPLAIAFAPEWSTRVLPAPSAAGRLAFRMSQAGRLLDLVEHGVALESGGVGNPNKPDHPTAEWSAWRFAIEALLDVPGTVATDHGPAMAARLATLSQRLQRLDQGDTASQKPRHAKETLLRSGRGLPIFDGNPGLIAAGEGIDYVLIEPVAASSTRAGADAVSPEVATGKAGAATSGAALLKLQLVSIARFWSLLFAGTAASLVFLAGSRFLPLGRFLVWVQARAWRGALVAGAVLWATGAIGPWGFPVVLAVLMFGTLETLARRRGRATLVGR